MPSFSRPKNEYVLQDIKNRFFPDIPFLDFKDYPLGIEQFSDIQHVNVNGSREFSSFVECFFKTNNFNMKKIKEMMDLKARTHNKMYKSLGAK